MTQGDCSFKKEGGGPARYDHNHRFKGFSFDAFPKGSLKNKPEHQPIDAQGF